MCSTTASDLVLGRFRNSGVSEGDCAFRTREIARNLDPLGARVTCGNSARDVLVGSVLAGGARVAAPPGCGRALIARWLRAQTALDLVSTLDGSAAFIRRKTPYGQVPQ
jgi:hypothetical protein